MTCHCRSTFLTPPGPAEGTNVRMESLSVTFKGRQTKRIPAISATVKVRLCNGGARCHLSEPGAHRARRVGRHDDRVRRRGGAAGAARPGGPVHRSEERRVGKEGRY